MEGPSPRSVAGMTSPDPYVLDPGERTVLSDSYT